MELNRLFLVLLLAFVVLATNVSAKQVVSHPPANEVVAKIHQRLTSRHKSIDFTASVQALINRVLTRAGVKFSFQPVLEIIDYEDVNGQAMDVFEIDSKDNQVVLRGSSGSALATAFGHYVRYYGNSDFHWENGGSYSFDAFPSTLETLPIPTEKERVVFLSKMRYYQNTCTASYSFVWKSWEQWEMEIDWAAMNGYNLPLAFTGQEIVWKKLWQSYGVSEEGLQQYFSGPAFLAWQRMANIRAFAGPLSDNWINQQADLQRNILNRYVELGMTPVLPAFNGVVPEEMQSLYPTANITRLPSWNNFPEQYSCNYILSSTEPLFQDIGKAFLQLQTEIFGEVANSHIYNCDTFNENKPASNDPAYLSGSSSAVYNSMIAADPDAIWLMQGWLFVNDPFWTDDNIEAYLSGVPDDGMIILDLTSEDVPVWNKIASNKKQFIWCMLHNYGGFRALYGNMSLLATDPINVQQTVPEYFMGTGITMEAIDQNPVVYEFMSEMAFHRTAPNVEKWVVDYADRRYGLHAEGISNEVRFAASSAWSLLLKSNYAGESPYNHNPWSRRTLITLRPQWDMTENTAQPAGDLVNVWSVLQRVGLSSNNAYNYDLVDVGRQVMGNLFYDVYTLALSAYNRKDSVQFSYTSTFLLRLIEDWDKLLNTHKSYLLGTWIADARALAKDATEADLFEYNARNQVTLWGDVGEIDDYAAKNWAGLAKGYYLKRWELLLKTTSAAIQQNTTVDMDAYYADELKVGQSFCEDYKTKFSTEPTGNTVEVSAALQKKYGNEYQPSHGYVLERDTDVDGNNVIATPMWTKNLKQLEFLCDIDATCTGFNTEGYLKNAYGPTVPKPNVHFFMKGKCLKEKC